MNIWKLTLNSSTGPSTSTHIFCTLPFFFPVSGILIYLSTLQPALVILPGCCHWFTGKLILIKFVGAAGFLFFFSQGCESEISSMVTEAQRKSSQCLDAALLTLGHLAAITAVPLNAAERGAQAAGKVTSPLIPQHSIHGKALGVHFDERVKVHLCCTADLDQASPSAQWDIYGETTH